MAAALVACKLGHTVGHVEAGLRSFDRTMPEEINRLVADSVADLLFIHSPEARTNLLDEGAPEESIFPVGNTMIDTLVAMLPTGRSGEHRPRQLGLHDAGLPAGHTPPPGADRRPAAGRGDWASCERSPASCRSCSPSIRGPARESKPSSSTREGIMLLDPLGYIEFMSLVRSAAALLTDSGRRPGGDHLSGNPVLHAAREHGAADHRHQGTNVLLGLEPRRIAAVPELLADRGRRPRPSIDGWDGARRSASPKCSPRGAAVTGAAHRGAAAAASRAPRRGESQAA